MGTLVRVDGATINVVPVNGKYFSLEEMQDSVGGYVETLRMDKNTYMLVNEEGLTMDIARNAKASSILKDAWKCPVNVFGNVLIVDSTEIR